MEPSRPSAARISDEAVRVLVARSPGVYSTNSIFGSLSPVLANGMVWNGCKYATPRVVRADPEGVCGWSGEEDVEDDLHLAEVRLVHVHFREQSAESSTSMKRVPGPVKVEMFCLVLRAHETIFRARVGAGVDLLQYRLDVRFRDGVGEAGTGAVCGRCRCRKVSEPGPKCPSPHCRRTRRSTGSSSPETPAVPY